MLEHFNCNVMILNKTASSMRLNGAPVNTHGDYHPAPPTEIAAGQSASFVLQHTNWSPYGTEGSCQYLVPGSVGFGLIEFSYSCPSGTGLNSADVVVLRGTGTMVNMIPNPLPQSGHPVNVQFIIS